MSNILSDIPWCGHLNANQYGCRRCALTRLEEATERLQARLDAALALHHEWSSYDECGHDHIEEDVRTGKAIDVEGVGLTCEEGKVQSVCHECHLSNGEPNEDTYECEWPCPTVKALRGEPERVK